MISLSQYAKRINVSRARATQFVKDGTLSSRAVKKMPNGRYQVNVRIANWDLKKNLDRGRKVKAKPVVEKQSESRPKNKKGKEPVLSFQDWKKRKEAALAKKHEFELDLLEQKYIDVKEVKRAWLQHISAAKTKLLGIPAKLTPIVREIVEDAEISETILQAIDSEIEGTLAELSRSKI